MHAMFAALTRRRPIAETVPDGAAAARRSAKHDQQKRSVLRKDLPRALTSGEIFIVYQPKIHLRSGSVDSMEALVRWQHPRFGGIPRTILIEVAEESGQMRDLTLLVLRQAIAHQRRLLDGGRAISAYVNISGCVLTDGSFVDQACSLVESAAGVIGFEITETALIDNPAVAMINLDRFVATDIRISIDDYGSGFSSLAYLKQLPAHELKIDKMFVSGMTNSHRDPLIVRSTIDLAHALGMAVVAEGVESAATLALLRVMGCDYAQGFVISRPLSINDLAAFLENRGTDHLTVPIGATVYQPSAFWARTDQGTTAKTSVVG